MSACPSCSRHVGDDLLTCPFCHSSIQQSTRGLKFRTENERRLMFASVLAALLILGGFWLPWLRITLVSGWGIALGSSGYGVLDLLDFPDLQPQLLSLFWLVPLSALLLLSVGWGVSLALGCTGDPSGHC
ncbi:hypothetical protein [Ktedonobacter sp. SOSP1-52]|uniref:hypothetical protein n=1 Tax=Ktedonobacter sp. SOSP1-52 TaxID=2778366 RepID=UPI001915F6B4|nr:hypothetical protein [Ktedonobacter sp. SOSP1-52]